MPKNTNIRLMPCSVGVMVLWLLSNLSCHELSKSWWKCQCCDQKSNNTRKNQSAVGGEKHLVIFLKSFCFLIISYYDNELRQQIVLLRQGCTTLALEGNCAGHCPPKTRVVHPRSTTTKAQFLFNCMLDHCE